MDLSIGIMIVPIDRRSDSAIDNSAIDHRNASIIYCKSQFVIDRV